MKYWLIFMVFSSDGEFITKFEYQAKSKAHCVAMAGHASRNFVNKEHLIQSWCVTDDHHSGRKQDPGIPYD